MGRGEDSFSRGCGFESQPKILNEDFTYEFVVKLNCLFEKTENE